MYLRRIYPIFGMMDDISTDPQLSYLDPKLYNELGLKYFSNYSASKMYKHFKDLVDKQNKEAAKHAEGGILKAQNGAQTPWRLNFDGSTHQMDNIYKLFNQYSPKYFLKIYSVKVTCTANYPTIVGTNLLKVAKPTKELVIFFYVIFYKLIINLIVVYVNFYFL